MFTAQDSGTKDAPVIFQNYENEQPVISGGVRLENLDWQPYTNGIFQAQSAGRICRPRKFSSTASGRFWRVIRILIRRRNTSTGYAADAISTSGVPRDGRIRPDGYFHAMHPALWGDFTWRITGKDDQRRIDQGGRRLAEQSRRRRRTATSSFVENIFEELDAPGEWFLNPKTHTLYFYPPAGLDLKNAVVEATRLRRLVEFRGDEAESGASVDHVARPDFPPGGAHGDGHDGAAAAFGLGDLSRRRDFLQRRGGLRAGRLLS